MLKQVINNLLSSMDLRVINLKYRFSAFENRDSALSLGFDHILSDYILHRSNGDDLNFIQIGAYDGIMHDPLRKYLEKFDWKGIMVEPQPVPYSKLQDLYSDRKEIILLNCVINNSPEQIPMYVIDDAAPLPEWMKGSASFYKQHLLKYKDEFPALEHYIKQVEVNGIGVEQLLDINHKQFIDLLLIDTEGYDGKILESFIFNKVKPAIIRFECKNLVKDELGKLLELLTGSGYKIAYDGGQEVAEDIIAVLDKHD